jgi:hypothetical protein
MPVAAAHTRAGEYLEMGTRLPRDWRSPYELVRGVPLVDYGTFKARNPVTTAQYGLANFSLWLRYGDRFRWSAAERAARWLVNTQTDRGAWLYRFPLDAPGGGPLPVPWMSALAQGQAMSLLGRVYRYTGDRTQSRAIERALGPLRQPVRDGGLARWYRRGLFFEEYPDPSALNFVLNGDAQALLGLYDVADIADGATSLFERGVRTLARTLPEFDLGSCSGYSLKLLSPPPPNYVPLIQDMLRALAKVTGRSVFSHYAERWTT